MPMFDWWCSNIILTWHRNLDDFKAIGVSRWCDTTRNSSSNRYITWHRIGDIIGQFIVVGSVFRPISVNPTKCLIAAIVGDLLFNRCYVVSYINEIVMPLAIVYSLSFVFPLTISSYQLTNLAINHFDNFVNRWKGKLNFGIIVVRLIDINIITSIQITFDATA